MSMTSKIAITVAAFFVALAISSAAFGFFLGHRYPAWIVLAALAMVSPIVFALWRDRVSR